MPVRVDFPTRLTVDVPALTERRDDLEEAVAAAVGRALALGGGRGARAARRATPAPG